MAFIDEARFFVKAGDGGNGSVSFRREKFIPRGGPDGGDGGNGGHVFIEACREFHSLIDFKYRSHFAAGNGAAGQGKNRHGRKGDDFVLRVPVGSVVLDAERGEQLADLVVPGQRLIAAQGGRGGRGNARFASSTNRAPRRAEAGQPGEQRWLRIELKVLADVGLVGLPNAGKSTLLSKLSSATPRIAAYPFTTLDPQLGVLQSADHPPVIIADIPGLIEGAHRGTGLGHKFLRHIERTRVLLLVIDAAGPGDRPLAEYQALENELKMYNDELLQRQRYVILNKADLVTDQRQLAALADEFRSRGIEALIISALTGQGLEALKGLLVAALDKTIKRARETIRNEPIIRQ